MNKKDKGVVDLAIINLCAHIMWICVLDYFDLLDFASASAVAAFMSLVLMWLFDKRKDDNE